MIHSTTPTVTDPTIKNPFVKQLLDQAELELRKRVYIFIRDFMAANNFPNAQTPSEKEQLTKSSMERLIAPALAKEGEYNEADILVQKVVLKVSDLFIKYILTLDRSTIAYKFFYSLDHFGYLHLLFGVEAMQPSRQVIKVLKKKHTEEEVAEIVEQMYAEIKK